MSKQATFDTVVEHLRKQGEASCDSEQCLYRDYHGRKCAAGCLIPDYIYQERMEGKVANEGIVGVILDELGHDTSLVRDLQKVHDFYQPKDWEWRLEMVAKEYGLVLAARSK